MSEPREGFYERMYEDYTEKVEQLRQQLRNTEGLRLAFFERALAERVAALQSEQPTP